MNPLTFPLINAILNATAAFFLVAGFIAVKQRKLELHKKLMRAAFVFSALFLADYLYYHFNYPSQKFGGQGWIRPLYFTILISHIILAVVILPFILRMVWLATQSRFQEHARIARWIWPLWMYTSVTGVLVYLMLYQWFPSAQILQMQGALR
jgi:putative membrane protein